MKKLWLLSGCVVVVIIVGVSIAGSSDGNDEPQAADFIPVTRLDHDDTYNVIGQARVDRDEDNPAVILTISESETSTDNRMPFVTAYMDYADEGNRMRNICKTSRSTIWSGYQSEEHRLRCYFIPSDVHDLTIVPASDETAAFNP